MTSPVDATPVSDALADNTPHTPEDRARQLITLTAALSDIFAQENNELRHGRPSGIAPLQADKARLAAAYAQSIRDVAADRATLATVEDRLMTELRDITRSFESRAREQRALLDGAQRASEGIVNAIAEEAAARDRTAAPGYSASGYSAPSVKQGAGSGAQPIAISEKA